MGILLRLVSILGLVLTIVPAILVFNGKMSMEQNSFLMLIGMILWFGATPFWMGKEEKPKVATKA